MRDVSLEHLLIQVIH